MPQTDRHTGDPETSGSRPISPNTSRTVLCPRLEPQSGGTHGEHQSSHAQPHPSGGVHRDGRVCPTQEERASRATRRHQEIREPVEASERAPAQDGDDLSARGQTGQEDDKALSGGEGGERG